MSILATSKLSRVQLIIMLIVFLLVVIFVMAFSADENNQQSVKSEHQDQANIAEQVQVQVAVPSTNTYSEYAGSQESIIANKIDGNSELSRASSQEANSSTFEPRAYNVLSTLDDESLLNISDLLENSLVPNFLSDSEKVDQVIEQKVAIDIFISRLPEGLSESDFQQINSLLRDYLPYDVADSLALKIEQTYRLHEQEQAYLSTALPNNKSPETMAEQMAIAKHLASFKGEEIQSTSNDPKQDIHDAIKHEYGAELADDHLELANIEKQWQAKYTVFLEEKNIISDSGLSEADKAEQIESLIQQHYAASEWAAVRAYDEMMQGQ